VVCDRNMKVSPRFVRIKFVFSFVIKTMHAVSVFFNHLLIFRVCIL
jgi:hypothetical protein